jgi:valyl-tRNA synthetase
MEQPKEFSLPPVYEPKEVEARWYDVWEKSGIFTASQTSDKPAFCMVIPPPNVTGSLKKE